MPGDSRPTLEAAVARLAIDQVKYTNSAELEVKWRPAPQRNTDHAPPRRRLERTRHRVFLVETVIPSYPYFAFSLWSSLRKPSCMIVFFLAR